MLSRRVFLSKTVLGCAAATVPTMVPTAGLASTPFAPEDRYLPQWVNVRPEFEPGTIVIWPPGRFLYLITARRKAIRYGVAVGKAGLAYYGTGTIERKVEWPNWRPTHEMLAREPKYQQWKDGMPGGPDNPLGARALYLFENGRDTMIRIHGTTQPWSIGQAASNGCFRMINEHVVDLYERVPLGTKVFTVRS